MKRIINEIVRMKKLAGIITESRLNEADKNLVSSLADELDQLVGVNVKNYGTWIGISGLSKEASDKLRADFQSGKGNLGKYKGIEVKNAGLVPAATGYKSDDLVFTLPDEKSQA